MPASPIRTRKYVLPDSSGDEDVSDDAAELSPSKIRASFSINGPPIASSASPLVMTAARRQLIDDDDDSKASAADVAAAYRKKFESESSTMKLDLGRSKPSSPTSKQAHRRLMPDSSDEERDDKLQDYQHSPTNHAAARRSWVEDEDTKAQATQRLEGAAKRLRKLVHLQKLVAIRRNRKLIFAADKQNAGVGLELAWDDDRGALIVSHVQAGGPAEGKVTSGNIVFAINGHVVRSGGDHVERQIRGEEGTLVELTLRKKLSTDKTYVVSLTRRYSQQGDVCAQQDHGDSDVDKSTADESLHQGAVAAADDTHKDSGGTRDPPSRPEVVPEEVHDIQKAAAERLAVSFAAQQAIENAKTAKVYSGTIHDAPVGDSSVVVGASRQGSLAGASREGSVLDTRPPPGGISEEVLKTQVDVLLKRMEGLEKHLQRQDEALSEHRKMLDAVTRDITTPKKPFNVACCVLM